MELLPGFIATPDPVGADESGRDVLGWISE